jgi:hypothetical protein
VRRVGGGSVDERSPAKTPGGVPRAALCSVRSPLDAVLPVCVALAKRCERDHVAPDDLVWHLRVLARYRRLPLRPLRTDAWRDDRRGEAQRSCVAVYRCYRSLGLDQAVRRMLETDIWRDARDD